MKMKDGKRPRKFKLKVSEYDIKPEDRAIIILKHKHLAELKKLSKGLRSKINPDLWGIFKNEINAIRNELYDNYAHKFYLTTITLGPHKQEKYFPYYPTSDDIVDLKETLLQKLSKNRVEKKRLFKIRKQFNGIEYEVVGSNNRLSGLFTTEVTVKKEQPKKVLLPNLKGGGNVFVSKGTILNLATGEGYARRIQKAKKPYDMSNYVGVEIELICSVNREKLQELFINAKLAGNVYIKDDSSISREKDGECTHEVTIIAKQPNINGVITRVCGVLNSKEVGSYVNDSCGVHVHMDMRNRNYPMCFTNFVNSLPVLIGMVPPSRLKSQYCMPNVSNDSLSSSNRRQAINPVSYQSHKTLEVRMHSGSTNAVKLNYWINILIAIAEHTTLVEKITTPHDMQQTFGLDVKTFEYIVRRTIKFRDNKNLNTKDDHIDQSA
jgi:hypothetical protein